MARPTTIEGPLRVTGNLTVDGDIPAVTRATLVQETDAVFSVPLTDMRVWDAMSSLLPAVSANDDLGLVTGTLGTHAPKLSTGDVKASTVTRYAAFLRPVPVEYVDGQTITCRINAGMETTIADNSATVDVQCYKSNRDGTSGSDICGTAAQSINSLTFADKDFSITPSGVASGDMLLIRIAVAVVDAATGTAVTASIGAVELLCDVKG